MKIAKQSLTIWLVVASCIFATRARAQDHRPIFQFNKLITLPIARADINRTIVVTSGDRVFWTLRGESYKVGEAIKVYSTTDGTAIQVDSMIVTGPAHHKSTAASILRDFEVNEYAASFLFYDRLEYLVGGLGGDEHKVVSVVQGYDRITLAGDTAFLTLCHPIADDYKHYTRLARVDLKIGKATWEGFVPDPEGLMLAYVKPQNALSVTRDFSAISEISSYKIRMIPSSGKNSVLLTRSPDRWVAMDTQKLALLRQKVEDKVIPTPLIELALKEGSSISRVDFVSDSLLLVRWYAPKYGAGASREMEVTFDLWKRVLDGWTLARQDVEAPQQLGTDSVSMDRVAEQGDYSVSEGKILVLLPWPFGVIRSGTMSDLSQRFSSLSSEQRDQVALFVYEVRP